MASLPTKQQLIGNVIQQDSRTDRQRSSARLALTRQATLLMAATWPELPCLLLMAATWPELPYLLLRAATWPELPYLLLRAATWPEVPYAP